MKTLGLIIDNSVWCFRKPKLLQEASKTDWFSCENVLEKSLIKVSKKHQKFPALDTKHNWVKVLNKEQ